MTAAKARGNALIVQREKNLPTMPGAKMQKRLKRQRPENDLIPLMG